MIKRFSLTFKDEPVLLFKSNNFSRKMADDLNFEIIHLRLYVLLITEFC